MKAILNNVLFKIDISQKEKYTLTTGTTLEIKKGFDFNLRQDRASMGYCIDADKIPKGASVLLHHLSIEPVYKVPYNEDYLTREEIKQGFQIFNVPADMCFAYREDKEWKPCENFLITLRLYESYKGKMQGVGNQLVKNRMYVVSGFDDYDGIKTNLTGKVVVSLDHCDYEIIWHDADNREYSLIRTRNREISAIDGGMTKKLKSGKYMIGKSETDCKLIIN